MNGSAWYDATHHVLSITWAIDASSSARGWVARGHFASFSVFTATAHFPEGWCDAQSGTTVVCNVDNKILFHAFRQERSSDDRTHCLIKRWMCSADNKEADDLIHPEEVENVRLKQTVFDKLWYK